MNAHMDAATDTGMDKAAGCAPTLSSGPVDIAALREKYRAEADKRRRQAGARHYRPMAGEFSATYEADPFSPPFARAPMREEIEALVLGGGFAGLLAAARLKQARIENVRIIDMAGDFGGTWYWNRYPGVQCDVESYSYLPLLEETGYVPRERYSYGAEIFEHCRRIGRHFDLYDGAIFQTVVRSMRWSEEMARWIVTTNRGDELRVRFLVMGPGPLNNPKFPDVPGLADFAGHSFHSSRWDFAYTGGDSTGGLHKLADRNVAIIGTGATGVQIVPHVARAAKHLYVFQRTPSTVDARGNRPTDPAWAAALAPGWQAERQRAFHIAVNERLGATDIDVVCDGWTELNRNLQARLAAMGGPDISEPEWISLRLEEEFRIMERLRRRVDDIVGPGATAEMLKAWYRFGCKRPCFNDDYLPAFARPNTTLVDVSDSNGIDRITANGIIANGSEYAVDCIIFASGFEVTDDLRRRFAIEAIEGRDKLSLYEHWGTRMQTLHGMTSHGFPNFFFTGYGQGGVSGSITLGYDLQAQHIAAIVREAGARHATMVEPSAAAQAQWLRTISENFAFDAEFWRECTPGYLNNEGRALTKYTVWGEPYGGGFYAFERLLQEWRDAGMPGMMFS